MKSNATDKALAAAAKKAWTLNDPRMKRLRMTQGFREAMWGWATDIDNFAAMLDEQEVEPLIALALGKLCIERAQKAVALNLANQLLKGKKQDQTDRERMAPP